MRIGRLWIALLSVPLCGGCDTVLRGGHEGMTFETVPTPATVIVDGKPYTSPASMSLARKTSHKVLIVRPGYRSVQFSVDPQWDGTSLIGAIIIPGGSVGLVADRVSGADMMFYKLAVIQLVPTTQPEAAPLVLNDFKGHLLTDREVVQAIEADKNDRSQFFRGQP
ncbi:MAG TPA: hypothetical protein VGG44_05675 [Tepidisphaeraceae bacterium]|jgi:hypothetical protein